MTQSFFRKWLWRSAIAVAILCALGVVLGYWLIATQTGAAFVLERAKSTFAGKLTIARSSGALTSPLELHDVEYRDDVAGIDIKVKSLEAHYYLWGILNKTLHLQNVEIDGVSVTLTSVTPAVVASPARSAQSQLRPPLDILLDRLHVGNVEVVKDGAPLFASNALDAAGMWTSDKLVLSKFALSAPDGRVDATGTITDYATLHGSAKVDVDWRLPADANSTALTSRRLAATLDVHGSTDAAQFNLRLAQPLAASARGTLHGQDARLPWMLDLDIPRMDPSAISGPAAFKSLALQLHGSGTKEDGTFSGEAQLNGHRVLLDSFAFAIDAKTFTLKNMQLRSPETSGALDANATLQLDAQPRRGAVELKWNGVELPADLVGQRLDSHGTLRASGTPDQVDATGTFALGPPHALADIEFALAVTPQKITLRDLNVTEPARAQQRGTLHASGDITLQPKLGWNLEASADKLDPGVFAKDWPGAIDFALSTSGIVGKDGPAGRLKLDNLHGSLRQRILNGSADIAFAAPLNVDGKINLSSGKSRVALNGRGGATDSTKTDVRIELAIDSLADWLPRTSGAVRGSIALVGIWPKLDATADITATKLDSGSVHLQQLALLVDAHDLSAPSGKLSANLIGLNAGGYTFDMLKIGASGNQATHHIEVNASGKPIAFNASLDGTLSARAGAPGTAANTASAWRGTLKTLALDISSQPHWQLEQPTAVAYGNGAFSLAQTCLRAGTPSVCIAATRDAAASIEAKFTLEKLPLALLARLAGPDAPLNVSGEINGSGALSQAADGTLAGQASITSAQGAIKYSDAATQALLSYQALHLDASLGSQSTFDLGADLTSGGRLDGHVVLGDMRSGTATLSGTLAASLSDLAFVDLLSPSVSATRGKLNAKFALSGTTARPAVDGELTLEDFATEVPAAGVKLHDGHLVLRSRDGENFDIDGSIASTDGKLEIKGSAGLAPDAPITLTVKGDDFLAVDIPGAKVHISPDLKIERDAKRLEVTGTLSVPQMFVDISKLPGGGSNIAVSPDVVMIDDAAAKSAAAALPIQADITVKLGAGEKLSMDLRRGTEVHLIGFGLNSNLSGQFSVSQSAGRAAIGRGQIQLDGTFKAYGQDLTIEQGRLLFAGTPVENPGLDIRATRAFPDQNITVGLQVRGTALMPLLTVFSTPAMEQSDALSYLVAGKPLSQLKGGEGNAVGSAASALGTAGGDLLAKSIGSKLGLDDVGVADNSSVGGAALTIGKYLSPRLYLSYGVGLFTPGQVVTLRYKLTRLFDFEMQNGTLSSRAGINYKIEK